MIVNIFHNSSDNKKLDKELTNISTLNINVREDVDVHEFDIILTNYNGGNYAFIETLGRYYFVNETKLNQTQSRLHFKCDVLMTFNNEIKNMSVILKRSTNLFNGYLNDDEMQAYSYEEIVCKKFPYEMNNDSIILMTVG